MYSSRCVETTMCSCGGVFSHMLRSQEHRKHFSPLTVHNMQHSGFVLHAAYDRRQFEAADFISVILMMWHHESDIVPGWGWKIITQFVFRSKGHTSISVWKLTLTIPRLFFRVFSSFSLNVQPWDFKKHQINYSKVKFQIVSIGWFLYKWQFESENVRRREADGFVLLVSHPLCSNPSPSGKSPPARPKTNHLPLRLASLNWVLVQRNKSPDAKCALFLDGARRLELLILMLILIFLFIISLHIYKKTCTLSVWDTPAVDLEQATKTKEDLRRRTVVCQLIQKCQDRSKCCTWSEI